jgi:ABC-type hemin transport system ATPase subunit
MERKRPRVHERLDLQSRAKWCLAELYQESILSFPAEIREVCGLLLSATMNGRDIPALRQVAEAWLGPRDSLHFKAWLSRAEQEDSSSA